MPQTTSFVIYAKEVVPLVMSNMQASKQLTDWISNLNPNDGQYLISYSENNDFLVVLNPQSDVDLSSLSQIQKDKYKKESTDDGDIHILEISNNQSLYFFQFENHLFMTSSLDGAKNILKIQKSQAPSLKLPPITSNVSLVIFIHENDQTTDQAFALISNLSPTIQKYAKATKEALLVVKGKEISGYINF